MLNRWMVICGLMGTAVACGEESLDTYEPSPPSSNSSTEAAGPLTAVAAPAETPAETNTTLLQVESELFTFINDYIEIDRLSGGSSADFGDANLYAFSGSDAELAACAFGGGADPYDGSCDARLPASSLPTCASPADAGPCQCTGDALLDPQDCIAIEFIDWNELLTAGGSSADADALATHRLLDEVKTDPDSFKNASCVTETKVLGKMDLTAAAVANNSEYAYLALKRHANNGDAGYTWLFTRETPRLDPAADSCSSGSPLVYDVSEGDVFISGNFNPSSGADLVVRRATAAADGATFLAADIVKVDLQIGGQPVWAAVEGTANVAAVNTTPASVGVLEVIDGVDEAAKRTDKNSLIGSSSPYAVQPFIVAEAGVDLDVFSGGGSLCGLSFYGSVVTQPSSSQTSDLKDLLGPQLFNFGSLSVTASLDPSCDKKILYQVDSLSGPGIETEDPDSVDGVSCEWTFTHTSGAEKTVSGCSGTLTLDAADPTGTWSSSVEVSIAGALSCSESASAGTVEVYDPLGVTVSTTDYCNSTFDYSALVSGGSGAVSHSWTFSGAGTVTPSTTTAASGSASVSSADVTYTATDSVTDSRTDIVCTASDSETAHPLAPIAVTISPSATNLTCSETSFDDAIVYTATASGGDGSYTYLWSGCTSSTGSSCTVNPSDSLFCVDQNVYVTTDDGSAICASAQSETEAYSKVTVVTSTDN